MKSQDLPTSPIWQTITSALENAGLLHWKKRVEADRIIEPLILQLLRNNGDKEKIQKLEEELKAVKYELQDWKECAENASTEPFHTDEKHCTCVPLLRMHIKELNKKIEGEL